jgi:hypothetical protein
MAIRIRVGVGGSLMVVMRLGMKDARGETERSEEKQCTVGHGQAEGTDLTPETQQLFTTPNVVGVSSPHDSSLACQITVRILRTVIYLNSFSFIPLAIFCTDLLCMSTDYG